MSKRKPKEIDDKHTKHALKEAEKILREIEQIGKTIKLPPSEFTLTFEGNKLKGIYHQKLTSFEITIQGQITHHLELELLYGFLDRIRSSLVKYPRTLKMGLKLDGSCKCERKYHQEVGKYSYYGGPLVARGCNITKCEKCGDIFSKDYWIS